MKKLTFKHHFKKLRCPFVIYADFECFNRRTQKNQKMMKLRPRIIKSINHADFMLNLVNAVDNY